MAKIKGICRNEKCKLCHQIQEVDNTDFLCESCQKPLIPFNPIPWRKKHKKEIILGGVAAVLLGGGGAAVYFLAGNKGTLIEKIQISSPMEMASVDDEITLAVSATPADTKATYVWWSSDERMATVAPQGDKAIVKLKDQGEVCIYVQVKGQDTLKDSCRVDVSGGNAILTNWISIMDGKSLTLKVGENKTLSLDCDPGNANEGINWSSSNESVVTVVNGTVTAVSAGKAIITATTVEKKNTTSIEVNVKSSGSVTNAVPVMLSYGTYTGESKNGKPHGMGRIIYTKENVINSHDPKKRTAKPGESVQGQFVNGEITIGKHFDASGNLIQALNFGVAP